MKPPNNFDHAKIFYVNYTVFRRSRLLGGTTVYSLHILNFFFFNLATLKPDFFYIAKIVFLEL